MLHIVRFQPVLRAAVEHLLAAVKGCAFLSHLSEQRRVCSEWHVMSWF